MKIYVATSNQGKLRDFDFAASQRCRSDMWMVELRPIPDLQQIPAPTEDALTFEENAVAKAIYYSGFLSGEIVLSDDSGLEVDALGGAPGVRSARYAQDLGLRVDSERAVDDLNNDCLLRELVDTVRSGRRARYRCAIAAARSGTILATSTGITEGWISEEKEGVAGFGYDSLFFTPEAGCTMAQVDLTTRMQISHRGRALSAMLAILKR